MKQLLPHVRKPLTRLLSREVALSTSLFIGLCGVAAAAVTRVCLEHLLGHITPFILTFPAVIGVTLVAGPPAGLVAILGCQFLTIIYVLPHWAHLATRPPETIGNIILSTVSLLLIAWATASYRRVAHALRRRCEQEVETLSLLINEMDHRTKNNFQVAAALLATQAATSGNRELTLELDRASRRLVSMASVYHCLSIRQPGSSRLNVKEHLEDICRALQDGLLPPRVLLRVTGDDVNVEASAALTIGLVVNEWVTNAAKYAFGDGPGAITVTIVEGPVDLHIEVLDDGIGIADSVVPGTGSRLMNALVEVLRGRTVIVSDGGTRCTLVIPSPSA